MSKPTESHGPGRVIGIIVTALAVAGGYFGREFIRGKKIPDHLLHHPAMSVPDLLTVSDAEQLRALAREMAVFPTNVQVSTQYRLVRSD